MVVGRAMDTGGSIEQKDDMTTGVVFTSDDFSCSILPEVELGLSDYLFEVVMTHTLKEGVEQ